MDKKSLSERDIRTRFIAPAIQQAGWDIQRPVPEKCSFTKGRIKHSMHPGTLHPKRDMSDWIGPVA